MPGCARKEIVRDTQDGIYHCWSRCVRRAFLLGYDPQTKTDYSHRRDWMIDRLKLLAANFLIDVGFFAILANHFHLVLRTHPRLVKRMGSWEVARRWLRVYPGKRVLDGKWIEPTEDQVKALARDKDKIRKIRRRLASVSWFMSALSEYLARRANKEDNVRGRFFEGRFGCRAIVTDAGLLMAAIYNDLNQIRAGEAATPESSSWCSVWFRLEALKQEKRSKEPMSLTDRIDCWLAKLTLEPDELGDVPAEEGRRASNKGLLPMSLDDYLRLLDFSGRQIKAGKRGSIPANLKPILERIGVDPDQFLESVDKYPQWFRRFIGNTDDFFGRAKEIGRRSLHGVSHARRIFRKP